MVLKFISMIFDIRVNCGESSGVIAMAIQSYSIIR